ncbi:MAG: hypothetical protein Q9160_002711 [Pyrenula sp. 1 TL-2023]
MEAFKLLTRSTGLKSAVARRKNPSVPSGGQPTTPQLFGRDTGEERQNKKRKIDHDASSPISPKALVSLDNSPATAHPGRVQERSLHATGTDDQPKDAINVDEGNARRILASHKIKVVNLSHLRAVQLVGSAPNKKKGPGRPKEEVLLGLSRKRQKASSRLFPVPLTSFQHLSTVYNLPAWVLRSIAHEGFKVPTEVQLGALPILLQHPAESARKHDLGRQADLLVVAPTGSGKTLAFLIALIADVSRRPETADTKSPDYQALFGLVVAPTKELAQQIVVEGEKILSDSAIRIKLFHKGDVLQAERKHEGLSEAGKSTLQNRRKPDAQFHILVTTPQTLVNALSSSNEERSSDSALRQVQHLVLDEADVLLDPLFRDQTLAIWNDCTNHDLTVSFWSATMGSNIESIVQETIDERCKRLSIPNNAPLIRLVVGLKDSALPTVSHKLVYAATEAGKLLGLRQLLHPTSITGSETTTPLRPPFLVFTQTIPRAIALYSELLYDIPVSAGGSSRLAVLHSDLIDHQRFEIMARFRKGQIWILITTDLLSRGIDFRGVNGVVNYDIPTSSAAYVHRAGRTGRAGREGGVCVTYYTKEDIPYVKNIANVIAASAQAGKIQGGNGSGGVQKWLLDALPDLTKREKKELKRRGVKARRSRDEDDDEADAKLKRRAKISTKSGYGRKLEHNRKVAKGTRHTRSESPMESQRGDEEFEGFGD